MFRRFLLILILHFFLQSACPGHLFASCQKNTTQFSIQDSLYLRQILYNGRNWESHYGNVRGNEYFLSGDWLPGELIMNNRTFTGIMLKYDILNDQLLTRVNPGTIIILNKQSVDKFTIRGNSDYIFINHASSDPSSPLGYFHLLRNGRTMLLVKYVKEIKILAIENKYDEFYQKQAVYLVKDNQLYRISSRKDLLRVLEDHIDELRKHVKEKNLKVYTRDPATIIPLLEYYDSLSGGN